MGFLVIQQIACEHRGAYEDEMRARRIAVERVEIDEGQPLPDWRFDAIIAMGGPMGACDDETLPWLAREKAQIAEAVHAGAPFWECAPGRSCSRQAWARAWIYGLQFHLEVSRGWPPPG